MSICSKPTVYGVPDREAFVKCLADVVAGESSVKFLVVKRAAPAFPRLGLKEMERVSPADVAAELARRDAKA